MQVQQLKLKNNLDTLFIDSPGSTFASVQIWFRAGSALEKEKNEGIAHFLEHMFFKGTPTRPGAQIAHEVESFGGEINAFTSFDYTCYYINTPNSYLKETTEILMDMVSNPEFKQEDLLPERDVVFEEFRRSLDDPNQVSFHKIQENSFSGGYAHPILGHEETIKNFSREQLIEFRKSFYNLSNALLVVSGDLKEKREICNVIEGFQLPNGNASQFPEFLLKSSPSMQVHKKDVNLAQLTMAIQAPSYEKPDAPAEDLAFNCLGHGETSTLYKNLVLSGNLASACSSSTMFMSNGGLHFIRLTFPIDKLKKITSELYKTFKQVCDEGFDKFDVRKIKNQYISSKVYEMESLESFAFSMGHGFAQCGDIHSDEEFIKKIKKTSNTAVNKSIQKIFERAIHIGLQIPKDQSEEKATEELKKFQKKLESLKKHVLKTKNKTKKGSGSKFDPQVQLIKIKKGVSLLYRHNPMNPTFVFHTYIRGGLTEETTKNNGSYHLLSGTITKGYKKVSHQDIKSDLEDKSAALGGFTGKNAYGLTLHGQTEHTSSLLKHFFGTMLSPQIPAKSLKHEKEMTLRAIASQEKDPLRQCFREVNKMMFHKHPYSRNVLGSKETVKKLKRTDLQEMHKKNLRNKEMLFTYCGDLDLEDLLDHLSSYLDQIPARNEKKVNYKKYKALTGQEVYKEFDREQTQIFHGIPTAKLGSKESIYLKMLTTHLSGQSSELFVEVRDRQGLCYAAQPIHFSALEGGYWGIYMASGHDKVKAAIAAIKKILEEIGKNGLSKQEFNRIKKMIEGQSLINVQTNEDYANIYSVPTLQGHGLDYYHKNNLAVKNLDYDEFQKNLKKILSKKWNTIIVGREIN